MKQQIKPKWLLCQNCIDALASRGEKPYVGKMISQDIECDNDDNWHHIDNEPIQKCGFCDEIEPELYECI